MFLLDFVTHRSTFGTFGFIFNSDGTLCMVDLFGNKVLVCFQPAPVPVKLGFFAGSAKKKKKDNRKERVLNNLYQCSGVQLSSFP